MISLKGLSIFLVLVACSFYFIAVASQDPVEEMTAAATSGDVSLLSKVLDEGYTPAIRDSDTRSPTYQTSLQEPHQPFEVHLKRDMGINTRGKNGKTALMVASCSGHAEMVKYLLDHGADINSRGRNWRTALMCASLKGHKEVAQLLLDRGADITMKTRLGSSALSLATDLGHKQVVELFIETKPELRFCACQRAGTTF
jgi:ankyrin repeat protein